MSSFKQKFISFIYISLSMSSVGVVSLNCLGKPLPVSPDSSLDASKDSKTIDSHLDIDSAVSSEQKNQIVTQSSSQEPTVSSVCPSDMVHVKGTYCPGLSHNCLKWKDKAWCRKHDPITKECVEEIGPVACAQFQIPGKCISKPNELEQLDFCIDIYEGGVKKGEVPPYMKSYLDGKKECAAQGKRLCTDIEWTKACEGLENFPYPYGYARNSDACNIDHPQIAGFDASKVSRWTPELLQSLDKRVPAGSMPLCVSPYGVHDMTGNVDEATVNVTGGGKPYWNALKGGHWVAGARNRCRPKTDSHEESFVNYESSFRCCKNSSN